MSDNPEEYARKSYQRAEKLIENDPNIAKGIIAQNYCDIHYDTDTEKKMNCRKKINDITKSVAKWEENPENEDI